MRSRGLTAAVILLSAAALQARAKNLAIGDAAPKLTVQEFVQGDAVAQFEKGKVYVVEFWATWCKPCVGMIPHLTELQKKYPDVAFVGVSIWDDASKVAPLVKKMGKKMAYRVAVDTEDASVAKNWMGAAGENGIPKAFIVDGDGKVAWIGHPGAMDEPLEKIHSGRWDLKVAAAEFAAAKKEEAERRAAEQKEEIRRLALQDAEVQAEVQAVEALGGKAVRSKNAEGHPIISIDFGGAKATDADLNRFTKLKKLRRLILSGCTQVTDAGLEACGKCKGLRELGLAGTQATDAGLKHLKGLKRLRKLDLANTRVTDAGIANLQKALPELQIER